MGIVEIPYIKTTLKFRKDSKKDPIMEIFDK
jgi:hypothetical protein